MTGEGRRTGSLWTARRHHWVDMAAAIWGIGDTLEWRSQSRSAVGLG